MSRQISRAVVAGAFALTVMPIAAVQGADLYTKAPIAKAPVTMVAPAYNWTGWYVGASVGYSSGNLRLGTPAVPETAGLDPSGGFVAIQGGYDYQFSNNWVLGARLTVPIVSIKDSIFATGATLEARAKSAVVLAARLGYSYGNYLPYVFGGVAWARGEGTRVGVGSATADHTGFVLGLGLEAYLARHWTIDVNYTYLNLSREGYNFVPFGGSVLQYGFESHNFLIGAHYRI
jgi:opacity protein-like surface antigen